MKDGRATIDAASVVPASSAFLDLAEIESNFDPPPALRSALESVRIALRDELPEEMAESAPLARAALVTVSSGWNPREEDRDRLISLAAGVEMIYESILRQQEPGEDGDRAERMGLLVHDLVLARALDRFATDGEARVMDAMSRGASVLCEALMAEKSGLPREMVARLVAKFHADCVRIGAAIGGMPAEWETIAGEQVFSRMYEVLREERRDARRLTQEGSFPEPTTGMEQEQSALTSNHGEAEPVRMEDFLSCWIDPCPA